MLQQPSSLTWRKNTPNPMLCMAFGTVTSDPQEMRRLAVDFYTNLYAKEETDFYPSSDFFNGLPVLDEQTAQTLESDLCFGEVTEAVHQLNKGKAPGIDGLPAEFYKSFWEVIGQDLVCVLKESFNLNMLPKSCQRAVLSLIPKKRDLLMLKNWRPVSVLTTDYKILSKCFVKRLKKVLDKLIFEDQAYCIPKKSIYDNLFLMRDILRYTKLYNVDFGIVSLDQEKAFDRVDHHYLFYVLKCYGFGEKFLSWIKVLYHDASCLIKVGGGLSVPVKMEKGIRQGCPMSGQLYSLAIEPLLCIRKKLKGIVISGGLRKEAFVLSAYADDVAVVIKNTEDVQCLEESLEMYGKLSSAKQLGKNRSLMGWIQK